MTGPHRPPRETGATKELRLDGLFFALYRDHVLIHGILGAPRMALPVFSTREQLTASLSAFGFSWDAVGIIEDQEEFLASVPSDIDVILDPREMPDGKVRYFFIQGEEPS